MWHAVDDRGRSIPCFTGREVLLSVGMLAGFCLALAAAGCGETGRAAPRPATKGVRS